MPADITGTEIIEENRTTGSREFRFLEGPLFANVILADEVNRTPPKTQAALLEAMQERQVTVGRVRTSWPIRSSCWPRKIRSSRKEPIRCPKRSKTASCSRFSSAIPAFKKSSKSPAARRPPSADQVAPVLTAEEILDLQRLVREVPITDHVMRYALVAGASNARRRAGHARFRPATRSVGAPARGPCSS